MATRLNKAKEIAKMWRRIASAQKQGYMVKIPSAEELSKMTARQIKGYQGYKLRREAVDQRTGETYKVSSRYEYMKRTGRFVTPGANVAPKEFYVQMVREFLVNLQAENPKHIGAILVKRALERWLTEHGAETVAKAIAQAEYQCLYVTAPVMYSEQGASEYLNDFAAFMRQAGWLDDEETAELFDGLDDFGYMGDLYE